MNNPYSKYQTSTISSASNIEQIVYIYDAVLKLLYQAKECILNKDFEGRFNSLSKATDIFRTMQYGVDKENGGKFAEDLDKFYFTTTKKMEDINIKNEPAEEVEKLIDSVKKVRDFWKELEV